MADRNQSLKRQERSNLLFWLSFGTTVAAVILSIVVVLTGVTRDWVGLSVFNLAVIPYLIAIIFSCATMLFASFVHRMALEEQEMESLKLRKRNTSAFEVNEDVRFTAKRTLTNYTKITPYVLCILAFVLIVGSLALFWRSWTPQLTLPAKPLQSAFLTAVLLLVSLFTGAFCIGQSREREFRWLRPVGAWFIVAFLVNVMATFAALMAHFGVLKGDYYLRNATVCLLAVLAIEFIVNFITEFYRPRTKLIEKPVFESRLLALFTEPGGVMRNIADTLDYQFGFQVSKTWIYAFLEKAITPLILIWLLIIWLFTAVVQVGPDEVGVREFCGKRISDVPLSSGLYFKAPWPFGAIRKFPVYRIHEIVVGPKMKKATEKKEERPKIVLWTVKHYASESRYLVAAQKENEDTGEVPVSFLSACFPVQYRIKKDGVIDYAYHFEDAKKALHAVCDQEVTSYLVNVDFLKIMSSDRGKATRELQEKIQTAVDNMKLGVEILVVNFHDSHPPVEEVAPAFQDVIGAREEKESEILSAKAYKEKIQLETEAETQKLVLKAEAYRYNVTNVSKAVSERFLKQYMAYKEMPAMFKLRTYLDFLERDTKDIRKYIVANSLKSEVYEINLEEKTRFDLLDADLTELRE